MKLESLIVEAVLYRLDSPELSSILTQNGHQDRDASRWQAEADAAKYAAVRGARR